MAEFHTSTYGCPSMQRRMYTDIEDFLRYEMNTHLVQSTYEVAEEKKRHAIATNSFHQGLPSITVVEGGRNGVISTLTTSRVELL